jgi:N-acetylglutamate synthase-like GNAT family acetyltransferase
MRIRTYETSDLDACRQLWLELTQWHRDLYETPTIGGATPWLKFDEHLELVGPEHVWIAEADGRVVGMTGLIVSDGEFVLEPIVVGADWRGQGVAAELARAVLEEAQRLGATSVVVKPVARNEAAMRFFHELGFDALGQLELIADFRPRGEQVWRHGASLAGRDFRL